MSSKEIAKVLLTNKAITLDVKIPYTFVSGIRSPIYCDNRVNLGYVEGREKIVAAFVELLKSINFEIVAGTSTAGIPWAAWVAMELSKPMCYVREEKKDHGKGNQIEGAKVSGKNVVVIEDLISTGGSSFNTVTALRETGANVVLLAAIFTYEFEKAKKLFEEGKCKVTTLTNFSTLVSVAKEMKVINDKELKLVLEWNKAPSEWGPKNGFLNAEPKVIA